MKIIVMYLETPKDKESKLIAEIDYTSCGIPSIVEGEMVRLFGVNYLVFGVKHDVYPDKDKHVVIIGLENH